MLKSDFYFDLPSELIAQHPIDKRDESRLLCLNKQNGQLKHNKFKDIINLLNKGDVLVVNRSKVLPARLIGQKENSGAVCELLLLKEVQKDKWECLARPGKRLKEGASLTFGDGSLKAVIVKTYEDGNKLVEFTFDTNNLFEKLDQFGQMPLPPYIQTRLEDASRYQTVYAKQPGSAAAPTAGLHFTNELLRSLEEKGVKIADITLHVGLGTFRPVKEENVLNHKMHSEYFEVSEQTANIINNAKKAGNKIIGVGTTTCRTLESIAKDHGKIVACNSQTDIFIYPGFKFKVLDGLITNFHLPESTLIMLVSAFCSYDFTMNAYKKAIEEKYRFFSFGDAMYIANNI